MPLHKLNAPTALMLGRLYAGDGFRTEIFVLQSRMWHKPKEHNKNYFKIQITFKHRTTGGEYEIVITHNTDCSTDKCACG
jgi:hypothetical protein